jgi:hypothetical protein
MSPGRGFIEEVEDFLFDVTGTRHIQRVSIGGRNKLLHPLLDFVGGTGCPLPELLV